MGWSVGISRNCRVKEFQNPTVHPYRSYQKESAYAVSKAKDLLKLKREKNEEQVETRRAHQSLRDRRAIEKPAAVTRHSEESQWRIAQTCISQTPCASFQELSGNIICLGRMTAPLEGGVKTDKRNVCLSNQTLSFPSHSSQRSRFALEFALKLSQSAQYFGGWHMQLFVRFHVTGKSSEVRFCRCSDVSNVQQTGNDRLELDLGKKEIFLQV